MHFKLSRVANHKRGAPSSTSTSSASLIKESPTLDTVVTTDDESESKLPPLDVEALTEAFAAKPASGFFSFHRGSGIKGGNSEDSEESELSLKELPSDAEDSSSTDELKQKPKHERNTSSGFFSFKLNRGSTSGDTLTDTPMNVAGIASADSATEVQQVRDVELKDDVVEPQEQIEVVPREDDSLSPSSSKQGSGFFSFKKSGSPATADNLNSKSVTVSFNTSVDNSSHSLKKEDQEEKELPSSNSSVVEEATTSVMKTEKQSSGWLSFSKKKRTEALSSAAPVEKIHNNDAVSVLSEGIEEEPTDEDIDEFLQAPLPEELVASAIMSKPEKQSSGLFSFRKKGRAPSPDRGSSPTNTVETTPASPPETPNIAEELAESVLVEDPFDILQEMVPPASKPSKSSSFFSFKLKSPSASNRKKLSKQQEQNHIPARARSQTEDTVSTLPDDLSIKTDDMSIKTVSVQSPVFPPVTPNLKNQKNGSNNDCNSRSGRYRKTRNTSRRNDHNMEPTVLYSPGTSTKPHDAPMTKNDLYFALDCEMVGVGDEGLESALARVCIVNWEKQVVLDTFVKVNVPITDYRTYVSGVTQEDVESQNAMSYEDVRATVKNILKGKILIGHALENDLNALKLTHPYSDTRDSATYAPFMREGIDQATGEMAMRPRKLRDLAWECLDRPIQKAGVAHSPIEDAVAALDLYKSARNDWEKKLAKESLEKSRQEEEQQRMRMYNMYAAQQSHQQQQQHQQAMAYNNQAMQHHLQHSPHHSPAVAASYNTGIMPGYHNQGSYHHQAHQHYGMQPRTPTPQSRFGFVPVYNRQRRNRGSRNSRNRQQDNAIPPQNLYVNSMSMQ